jgi:hypothetical protein
MDRSLFKQWDQLEDIKKCYIWKGSGEGNDICVEKDIREQWKTFLISLTPFKFKRIEIPNTVIYQPTQSGGFPRKK